MSDVKRPAEPGEVCSCGRPAVVVYVTDVFGDVGFCGVPDAEPLPEAAS